MNYDPNLLCGDSMTTQTVRLCFQVWDFKGELEERVVTNKTGMSVIEGALRNAMEQLRLDSGMPCLLLKNSVGETLHYQDFDGKGLAWLTEALVSAEITAIEANKTKENSA